MREADYPALYQTADQASLRAQRWFFNAVACNLLALVVAAVPSIVGSPATWLTYMQIMVLLFSLGTALFLAIAQPQRVWYGTRALAESVKTLSWRFMMRAEPFDSADNVARSKYAQSLMDVLKANQEVSKHAVPETTTEQVTNAMRAARAESLTARKLFYVEKRVNEQRDWYARKARANRLLARNFTFALVVLNVFAVGLSIARLSFPTTPYWPTDVFIAAAGAAMAWLQAKRFQELAASYTLTAHEIGILGANVPAEDDEGAFSVFVGDAENAFSREHTQWFARKDE
jgi:hypothetical protein